MDKPDIVQVIGPRVELRRAGKEFVGLCPFHDDRRPSFCVNPDKQVFLCRACQARGDVIAFLMLLDGLTFPQAKAALGIDGKYEPRPKPSATAALLANWLNNQFLLVGARCRDLSQQIVIARNVRNVALVASLTREFEILADLHEDLAKPKLAAELWKARELIEALTDEVEIEPLEPFPPLTDDYRNRLKDILR